MTLATRSNTEYKNAFTWWQKNKGWAKPALWAAGIAAVVGGGVYAYQDHQNDKDKKKDGSDASNANANAGGSSGGSSHAGTGGGGGHAAGGGATSHQVPAEEHHGEEVEQVAVDTNNNNHDEAGHEDPHGGENTDTVVITDPNEASAPAPEIIAISGQEGPDTNADAPSDNADTVPSVIVSVPAESSELSSDNSNVVISANDFCNGNAACIEAANSQNLVSLPRATRGLASNTLNQADLEEACLKNSNAHSNCNVILKQLKNKTQSKKKSILDLLK